jgi:sterol desaturase/sphingolipid hydroxylase (fatty acid hydroxylase superfamily)
VTAAARSEVRQEFLSRIPVGYSAWAHLAVPSLLALTIVAASLASLRRVEAWQIAVLPAFLVAGNAVEWHAHRGLLHRRVRILARLHRAHALHHRIYATDDMAMRDPRELRLVVLPWDVLLLPMAVVLPVASLLAAAGHPNLAALWLATAAAHVLAYEWLHLLYHLPPGRLERNLPFLAALRHHHALHHSPRLHRFNLNVTLPLWDALHGTLWQPGRGGAVARRASP